MNHSEAVLIIGADATSITTVLYKMNVVHAKVCFPL